MTILEPHSLRHKHVSEEDIWDIPASADVTEQGQGFVGPWEGETA